jgi:hypothetical protein
MCTAESLDTATQLSDAHARGSRAFSDGALEKSISHGVLGAEWNPNPSAGLVDWDEQGSTVSSCAFAQRAHHALQREQFIHPGDLLSEPHDDTQVMAAQATSSALSSERTRAMRTVLRLRAQRSRSS